MRCPSCGERESRVVDSRDLDESATIRRRRECSACSTRFTTYERVEAARLTVVKRGNMVHLRDAKGGEAMVTIADVNQRNGVIHVVDTVLMPRA